MSYSQALEEQIRLLAMMESRDFADFERTDMAARSEQGLASDPITPRMYDLIRESLRVADPYYWAPSMTNLILKSAWDLPHTALVPEVLPSRGGFWWLGAGLTPHINIHGIPMHARALMWHRREDGQGIYLAFGYERTGLPNLFPGGLVSWHFGRSAADCINGAISRLPGIEAFQKSDEGLGEASRERALAVFQHMRIFHAGLLFIQQRLLIASQQRIERHARKRLEREGFTHEPLIRVVELRRKQAHSEHHADSESVEWSHQWIVSGHWRQQWYPSLNANQPRWIMPYVKGPEDKPLKPPRAKVFAVVR